MPGQHQLTVILFADIVDYTALMQRDEAKALVKLDRFKERIEAEVKEYGGKIIQFYGDGCLATFTSALRAVSCARTLQQQFREEPTVPVRIGIHLGDVLYKEGLIFGDSVNLTARIEGLGTAGTILFSNNIEQQLRNKSEFKVESLGHFEFKNVDEPVEVFALANDGFRVPKRQELQGKLKKVATAEEEEPEDLSEVRVSRIAILPFENKTNDPELDILGDMASDWISKGLMEIEDAEVVSPFTIRTHLQSAGILPGNADGKPSFHELTGADNLIRGSYYQENGDLIFHLEVSDARLGKVKYSFPVLKEEMQNRMELISTLRDLVSAYWLAHRAVDKKMFKPPKYEAYKSFLKSVSPLPGDDELKHLQRAIELDSHFHLAKLHFIMMFSWNPALDHLIQEYFKALEKHQEEFTFYESLWFDYVRKFFLGDFIGCFHSLSELRRKFPRDFIINHESGYIAQQGLNNPMLSLSVYSELEIDDTVIDSMKLGNWFLARLVHQGLDLLYLGKAREAYDFVEKHAGVSSVSRSYRTLYCSVAALIDLGQPEAALKKIEAKKKIGVIDKREFLLHLYQAALYSLAANRLEYSKVFCQYGLGHMKRTPLEDVNYAFKPLFLLVRGDCQEASQLALSKLQLLPYDVLNWDRMQLMLGLGIAYARTGRKEAALSVIEEFDKFTNYNFFRNPDIRTQPTYFQAVVYAQLGDFDMAVERLQTALANGKMFTLLSFEKDPWLQPLKDHPSFQELVKPQNIQLIKD